MHVVLWETNKTRFSKYTSPQIGENQNCPTWVRSPLNGNASNDDVGLINSNIVVGYRPKY